MLTIRWILDGRVQALSPDEVERALADGGYLWIDLEAPTDEEAAVLRTAGLGLDEFVIEDLLERDPIPRLDVADEQTLSLTVHGIDLRESVTELTTTPLSAVITPNLLITSHRDTMGSATHVLKQLDRRSRTRLQRPVQVFNRILDVMHDVFLPFLDRFEQRLDLVEEDILSEPTEGTRREIYALQRDIIQFRRAVVPQAEVVRRLARAGREPITSEDIAYLHDVRDHLQRMVALSDSYRQLLDSALQSYQSSVDNDLNEMLRVLTLVNAVLLPVSVIAGIYGTNFVRLPGSEVQSGFWIMIGGFALLIAIQFTWFRARGWIGRDAERAAAARRSRLPNVLEIPVLGRVLEVPASVGSSAIRGLRGIGSLVSREAGSLLGGRDDHDSASS